MADKGGDALWRLLDRRVGRRIGRRTERYTMLEAVIVKMGERAMAGEAAAARELIRLAAANPAEPDPAATEPRRVEIRWTSQEGPEDALRLLGICQPNGSRPMLLNQWAVDAALAQDPGLWARLSESERASVDEAVAGTAAGTGEEP